MQVCSSISCVDSLTLLFGYALWTTHFATITSTTQAAGFHGSGTFEKELDSNEELTSLVQGLLPGELSQSSL